uniref:LysM peptidoglycan-binding domain-containing protein n=1 Tax=Caldilinea aerophila TaxID=133453 RepID=A0A7C1FJI1_9CHLR
MTRRNVMSSGVRAGVLLLTLAIVLAAALTPAVARAAPQENTAAAVMASGGCVAYHRVRLGENLTRISRIYGVSVWHIAQVNGIRNPSLIYVGQVLCIPSTYHPPAPPPPAFCGQYYTVQLGDTLSRIARRCGVTVRSLVSLNGISNPNYIRAGQVLRIY